MKAPKATGGSLLARLKSANKIKDTDLLADSVLFKNRDLVPTPVPMINVALSGSLDGGLAPGHLMIAGPSKHFKTMFALLCGAAYLNKHPDSYMVFYDTEFGASKAYFESFGIDLKRVIHKAPKDIEEMKNDMVNTLNIIERGDHAVFVIDSIGNAPSKKEVEDATDGKVVVDMTRAKSLKSLFRMVTTAFVRKNIPLISINHTYQTPETYSRTVVGGGTGSYYSANDIWIVGRQQEKVGDDFAGFNFVINIEKSRLANERTKIPITVIQGEGLRKYSGLFQAAMDLGFIIQPKSGWYSTVDLETGEIIEDAKLNRKGDVIDSAEFWEPILKSSAFRAAIEKEYRLAGGSIMPTDLPDDAEDDETEN